MYDESLEAAAELQSSDSVLAHLDPMDFGRRVAVEKELLADAAAPHQNAIFDDSGNFVLFSTLLGIKVRPWCFERDPHLTILALTIGMF